MDWNAASMLPGAWHTLRDDVSADVTWITKKLLRRMDQCVPAYVSQLREISVLSTTTIPMALLEANLRSLRRFQCEMPLENWRFLLEHSVALRSVDLYVHDDGENRHDVLIAKEAELGAFLHKIEDLCLGYGPHRDSKLCQGFRRDYPDWCSRLRSFKCFWNAEACLALTEQAECLEEVRFCGAVPLPAPDMEIFLSFLQTRGPSLRTLHVPHVQRFYAPAVGEAISTYCRGLVHLAMHTYDAGMRLRDYMLPGEGANFVQLKRLELRGGSDVNLIEEIGDFAVRCPSLRHLIVSLGVLPECMWTDAPRVPGIQTLEWNCSDIPYHRLLRWFPHMTSLYLPRRDVREAQLFLKDEYPERNIQVLAAL